MGLRSGVVVENTYSRSLDKLIILVMPLCIRPKDNKPNETIARQRGKGLNPQVILPLDSESSWFPSVLRPSLSMAAQDWQAQAQISRDVLDKSIQKQWLLPADKLPSPERTNVLDVPKESGVLTERELKITETDATGLVESMAKGTWTAEEVAIAFLKRATIGHQLLNYATEFMAEDALAQARALDAHFRSTGKVVGPLHGVPISTKEMVSFKGRIMHTGYVSRISNVASQDALIVTTLRKAGAVFHVRTNLPQTCMVRGFPFVPFPRDLRFLATECNSCNVVH